MRRRFWLYRCRVCVWGCEVRCVQASMWSVGQCWPREPEGWCEQQGFGVDPELCQGLVAVDNRAGCPSVLNKRMSRIKRQCSPVCRQQGSTPHIRNQQAAPEPQADMMHKRIDRASSAGHLGNRWESAICSDATSNLTAAEDNGDKRLLVIRHTEIKQNIAFVKFSLPNDLQAQFYSSPSFWNSLSTVSANGVSLPSCHRR